MNRILKALGIFVTMTAVICFSTSSEEATSQKSAAVMMAKAKCPYPNPDHPDYACATIDTSGESYCRVDEGSNIAVREIPKEVQYETNMDVPILLRSGDGKNGHCSANAKLPEGLITISIKREPGGGFDMNAGDVLGHIHLEPVTSTVGRAHWLHGSNELLLDKFDYVVYLLDEPQGEATIRKRYRLEVFDKNCQSHMPKENINFGPKSKFGCTPDTTAKGSRLMQEATSGDGYEPKK